MSSVVSLPRHLVDPQLSMSIQCLSRFLQEDSLVKPSFVWILVTLVAVDLSVWGFTGVDSERSLARSLMSCFKYN